LESSLQQSRVGDQWSEHRTVIRGTMNAHHESKERSTR